MSKKVVTGYFNDEKDLKSAIKQLQENDISIADVFTPFPVHGLEKLLKYRRTHIPKIGFWAGAAGTAAALGFQIWVNTLEYPIIFGGKPYLSLPSFIPVTFELTVLFSAFAMVFAFLVRSNLGLGAKNTIYDPRITDDRFLILLEPAEDKEEKLNQLKEHLSGTGANDVKVQKK